MKRYEIINLLGKKFNFKSYLEISSLSLRQSSSVSGGTTGYTYNNVNKNIFTTKSGIYYIPEPDDINTDNIHCREDIDIKPNRYEYHHNKIINKNIKYDIVFVDSWNTYIQTHRDLEMALEHVSPNGFIIVRDCCPPDKFLIGPYKKGLWCGQTYEAFINFRYNHRDLHIFCIDVDFGCGIISLNNDFFISQLKQEYEEYDVTEIKNWKYFYKNKNVLLNLIDEDKFMEYYNMTN